MTQQTKPTNPENNNLPQVNWRTRSYLIWTALGTVLGVIAGYLYNRSAKEHAEHNGGQLPEPGTLELIGLVVAALAIVRQVAELGKLEEKPKK